MDTSTISPEYIDTTAEETCPAPSIQVSAPDETVQQAAAQTSRAPTSATFELMDQLEALARDVAQKGSAPVDQIAGASPDQPIESGPAGPGLSPGMPAVGSSIIVSPRPAGFENDPFANHRVSPGGRTTFILAGLFMAVLIVVGATFAWQTMQYIPTVKLPEQSASIPGAQVPASGTTASRSQPAAPATPASSPDFAKQLDAMAQDLASVRRGIEQLTAKQEQLAAAQQQLERLTAKQDQLAAKQEQMAQNVAKLQALEQATRQKTPAAVPSRTASIPPRVTPEPVAQLPPPPRSPSRPVPPLPVPP